MKKYANRLLMLFALLMIFSIDASAQIEIRIRPSAPVVRARPIPPSRRHVWIDGGWTYRGNAYVWSDGYWVVPRRGMVWVPGRWRHSHRGYTWIPGQWRRRY
ncbi:MAG TPA: YXWGXW repeat-containing protein [Chitinophagaceae bacterium]|nr:YXWGXW repeat-containing protein [Chitinophagaceae bacterium]